MGQVYSNESGSVKAYAIPEVPGGIVGDSAALAIAQGARTPADIAYLTAQNSIMSVVGLLILVSILYIFIFMYRVYTGEKAVVKKEPFTSPVDESDGRCAPFLSPPS